MRYCIDNCRCGWNEHMLTKPLGTARAAGIRHLNNMVLKVGYVTNGWNNFEFVLIPLQVLQVATHGKRAADLH